MKAVVLEEPMKCRHRKIAEPDALGPDEVLVRGHRVGINGTDISGYWGKIPFYRYARRPGHELRVEVVAVGDNVSHVAVGDRYSVEPYVDVNDTTPWITHRITLARNVDAFKRFTKPETGVNKALLEIE